MFKTEIQKEVENHFNKLIEMGYNVVGVFLYGSQNYELDSENSDVDTVAIILPTINDIIFNNKPVSTSINIDKSVCVVKDVRKMFECYKKQNINYIETLFTQYYVLNPVYSELYKPILDNAESIARYNNYAGINCVYGMALKKFSQFTHPYPKIKDKIDKYGYDNKQFYHILRLKDFIQRYVNGVETYKEILIPSNKEELLKIKTEYIYSLEETKKIGQETCDWIKEYKDNYMKNNPLVINKEIEELMNSVMMSLILFNLFIEKDRLNKN